MALIVVDRNDTQKTMLLETTTGVVYARGTNQISITIGATTINKPDPSNVCFDYMVTLAM
jgi:hypothetical protein